MTTAGELAGYASNLEIFRNKIINGNFDIWQRGTSQTTSDYGSADMWRPTHAGSTKTASQQAFTLGQTEVPGNPKYYLRHVVSSVAGSGNFCLIIHKIEGVSTLAGQTATLSFWARTTDSNKNIATEFLQYFGTGGSPSALVNTIGVTTHNLTTSWQKFTATVVVPSISGKTLGSDGNDRLELNFWFETGSDFSSRTNSLGNQSGTFDIAQVQLEEGSITPFEKRPTGIELQLCQRYYNKSYNLGIVPGTGYNVVGEASQGSLVFASTPYTYRAEVFQFPVAMVFPPAIILYSPYVNGQSVDSNGNPNTTQAGKAQQGTSSTLHDVVATNIGESNFSGLMNNTAVASNFYYFHYIAKAEL